MNHPQFGDQYGVLSQSALDLYARITEGDKVKPDDQVAVAELLTWRLIDIDPGAPEDPVALDPRAAAARRQREELELLAAHAEAAARLPSIADDLALHFDRSRWRAGTSEYIADREEVNARLGAVVGQAQEEILAAQPGGPRTRTALDYAVERDTQALERGIRMRSLYRDSVRDDPITREWAVTMTGLGGRFRTMLAPFPRCIIVDRRKALVADFLVDGGPEHAAWYVTDRAVVAYMAAGFDDMWRRAQDWWGEPREKPAAVDVSPGGVRTSRLQREIMRDTANGIDQKRTARRLGIGLRTVTREIEALREAWQATTLAQLAFMWASSPDRLVDDLEQGEGGRAAA